MAGHPAVAERLRRLSPDQRAAATARPGPILCLAPAGSGKTTTLIARIAWLVDGGTNPATIAAITFNRRAATELDSRLAEALEPLEVAAGGVRVRTFHALGREILDDAGRPVGELADRRTILARLQPDAGPVELAELDTAISRLKVDLGLNGLEVSRDAAAGPVARAFVSYERELAATGSLDFDDLVITACHVLAVDAALLDRWRARCGHLLVDEVQDLDRSQLELAMLPAAPANRIFLVGDDDQSIYGWRLADVRRVFRLAARLPGLERHQLVTNYRCPRPVVECSLRLISRNRERFAKGVRAGPDGAGRLVLAPDGGSDDERIRRVLSGWPADGTSRAVIARTNAELVPAAAVAVAGGIPFRAASIALPLEAPGLDQALTAMQAKSNGDHDLLLLVKIGRVRAASADPEVRLGLRQPDWLGGAIWHGRGPGRCRRRVADRARPVAPRRGRPQPHHGSCGQGPRVRPRGRADGRRPVSKPAGARRGGRSGADPRGGAPAGLRGLDPRPAVPHPALRPG